MKKNKKLLGILLTAVLILGMLPINPAQATVGAGEIVFTLIPNDTVTMYYFADVDIGSTYVGYSVINISHPAELQLNYNGAVLSSENKPANWTVTISTATGGTVNITIMIYTPTANGMDTDIKNFLNASTLTLKADKIYPPAGSGVTIMISEQTIVKFTDENGRTHVYEFVEFAKQANNKILTWLEAYNAARGRSFAGRQGYLATLTSIEEQMFVYNTIAQKPGWLGGTRLRYNSDGNRMIDGLTDISTDIKNFTSDKNIANVWYWADGPEAGTVFYNAPVRNDTHGPIPGVFNFFSNGWTYNTYPQYRSYIQNGSEPNGDGGECCLQFAWSDKASWNDLVNNSTLVQGFYVEYDFPEGLSSASGVATAKLPIPITVSFVVGNNFFSDAIGYQTVLTDDTATQPTMLEIDKLYLNFGNKKFLGWFENLSDITPFDFSTPITAANTQDNSKILYGKWEQYYNVSFANTRGNIATAQGLPSGGFAVEPDTTMWSDEAFKFYGWSANITDDYMNFTPFDFNTPIDTDTIVYGMWDPIIYSLIFDPNGGSWGGVVTPRIREYCPGATDPPWENYDTSHVPEAPVRMGYIFDGWMDEKNSPPPDTPGDIFISNVYYAQWILETIEPPPIDIPPEEPPPEEPTPEESSPVDPPPVEPPLVEQPPIEPPSIEPPQWGAPSVDTAQRDPSQPAATLPNIEKPSIDQQSVEPTPGGLPPSETTQMDVSEIESAQIEPIQTETVDIVKPLPTENSPQTGDTGFPIAIVVILFGFSFFGVGMILCYIRKAYKT